MMNLSAFPACAKRLEFQKANITDPAMNAYWAAVCIAEDFSDDRLARFGGFNFDLRTEANGYKLLGRLESLIRSSRAVKAKSDVNGMSAAENTVRATLGAFGVKVSKLEGLADYWAASSALWPSYIVPPEKDSERYGDIDTLRFQIARLSKKQRKVARQNVGKLPAEWQAALLTPSKEKVETAS